jgi:hypothetical protein
MSYPKALALSALLAAASIPSPASALESSRFVARIDLGAGRATGFARTVYGPGPYRGSYALEVALEHPTEAAPHRESTRAVALGLGDCDEADDRWYCETRLELPAVRATLRLLDGSSGRELHRKETLLPVSASLELPYDGVCAHPRLSQEAALSAGDFRPIRFTLGQNVLEVRVYSIEGRARVAFDPGSARHRLEGMALRSGSPGRDGQGQVLWFVYPSRLSEAQREDRGSLVGATTPLVPTP